MKSVNVILQKMLTYAKHARDFITGVSEPDFYENTEKQYSVCLALLQIGEMVSLLPESFLDKHQEIPWRGIKGLRNIIAHNYSSIDDKLIWQYVSRDIPVLIADLEAVIPVEQVSSDK